jgi:integrase
VDMIGRSPMVRRSKTEAGERVIPLNADAWAVILELYRRSRALGATEPSHFLFAACETVHFDPTRCVKSWRTAWRRPTRAVQCAGCGLLQNPGETCAGCKAGIAKLKSPFEGFRFHDLRHQAITELAESKASDQTIMSIAGHVSRKMLAHYSHVRLDAKRNALEALTMGRGNRAIRSAH